MVNLNVTLLFIDKLFGYKSTSVLHLICGGTLLNPQRIDSHGLIENDGKISFETSSIDRVHVISCTLVDSRVHLGGRVNFYLGFELVLSNPPLMGLEWDHKLSLNRSFTEFTYVHINMSKYFYSILKPGDMWTRIS